MLFFLGKDEIHRISITLSIIFCYYEILSPLLFYPPFYRFVSTKMAAAKTAPIFSFLQSS